MKTVTAFVGSARRKHTFDAARRLLDHLEKMGDVKTEIVSLSEYHLEACRGCKLCFGQGEEACPLRDDRDLLIEKLTTSDGVVFASPSYMFQVSGLMKTWIDRLAFFGHRPHFFRQTFTNIVVQGLPFDSKIGKYLNFVGSCFGFRVVKGSRITARDPMTERDLRRMDAALAAQSHRFFAAMNATRSPVPSLAMLIGFRVGRTIMKIELDDRSRDYRHYGDKGWFDSAYYYPVRLGLVKRALGWLFDVVGARMARRPQA